MANSLIASASVLSVSSTGMSFLTAPSTNKSANTWPCSERSPTTMRLGYKLSCSALPSRKNSGENIKLCVMCFNRMRSVKPTGTVDLITIVACGLMANTSAITDATDLVLK